MEPRIVYILDFCTGVLNIIKLTEEELKASEEYTDFEDFLSTLEEKYGFRLSCCNWMVSEKIDVYCYVDGKEVDYAELG